MDIQKQYAKALKNDLKPKEDQLKEILSTWGCTLAFAATANTTKAQVLLDETLVTLGASKKPLKEISKDFAHTLYLLASQKTEAAIENEDLFFKLPLKTRLATVLKTKAAFTKINIAEALNMTEHSVGMHLGYARTEFRKGEPWITKSTAITMNEKIPENAQTNPSKPTYVEKWTPECAFWQNSVLTKASEDEDMLSLFADYISSDLDTATERSLYAHFALCPSCRANLAEYKTQFQEWMNSVPEQRLNMANSATLLLHFEEAHLTARTAQPNFLPGIVRMFKTRTTWVGLGLIAIAILFIQLLKYT